jgi:predicted Zn-dependent protease
VEFSHNDLEDGEKKMWASLKTEVTPANAQQLSPGELKIHDIGKFKTVPDTEIQAYVERIGASLIPVHQRELPASDPSKIPFQFYVVVDKTPNAFATPNGIVVVNSGLFAVLENEAQLAFILSHEVSHAVQEHSWRQTQHLKVRRGLLKVGAVFAAAYGQYDLANLASMFEGALRNGYSRSLENQADRMGLEGMVAAGYDPRQAPQCWKALTRTVGDSSTDWFWSAHDNNATRRSYLMNELKNNYARLDYESLRVEAEPFDEMAARAKAASAGKQKIKLK